MTLAQIMKPILAVFEWMQNRTFYLGEYPFTFWELFLWSMFASLIVGFIVKSRD